MGSRHSHRHLQHEKAFVGKSVLCLDGRLRARVLRAQEDPLLPLYLQPYDSNLPTTFMADTSPIEGMGFILTQEGEGGKKHVIHCRSVAAKKSWHGLSPLEAECLGGFMLVSTVT